jgi:phosphoribosylaminoimidazolecarboxamide formyltransferase/IMP cyclohydrolase
MATRSTISEAYKAALQGDPISAFGGVLISNRTIDLPTAEEINKLFCEVVIAPSYDDEALEMLKSKKNRIILIQKDCDLPAKTYRSALNGILEQDKDLSMEGSADFEQKSKATATQAQLLDLEFAVKLVKHTKSNTITFVKDQQLCASGTGQTSRVDACRQAIEKAGNMGFSLENAVMASDAFFPFPDCVELAHKAGITAVVQPGGSIKDQLSTDYCDENNMAMYFTGVRHFRH